MKYGDVMHNSRVAFVPDEVPLSIRRRSGCRRGAWLALGAMDLGKTHYLEVGAHVSWCALDCGLFRFRVVFSAGTTFLTMLR